MGHGTNMKKRAAGSGGIFQSQRTVARSGVKINETIWVAQIRRYDPLLGESRKVRRTAKSEREAQEKLRELRKLDIPNQSSDAGTRVADYLDRYAANSLHHLGLSERTVDIHKTLIANPLKPTLGEVKLGEFDIAVAELWIDRLNSAQSRPKGASGVTTPLSGATRHRAFYVLAKALDVAVRDRLIETNPLRSLKPPRVGRAVVPVTGADDFDNLIVPAVTGMRIGPLVVFVGLTGCRLGEALGLYWPDVDLDRATATFRRSGPDSDRTKTGRSRTVPLLPEVVDVLRERRRVQLSDAEALDGAWQNHDDLVFTTFEGRPMNPHNARKDFQGVLRRKGLNATRPFHSLRHGLASRLLKRKMPMHVVSAILGHSSIRVTVDIYGHVEPVMHADEFAEALGRSRPHGKD